MYVDFSRKDYSGPPITDLLDIISYVKPTALMGLSTTAVCFTTLGFFDESLLISPLECLPLWRPSSHGGP